jgi:hypothetical protein
MKTIHWIVLAVVLVIVVTLMIATVFKRNTMYNTPIDSAAMIDNICQALPGVLPGENYTVEEYRNSNKKIGGFIVYLAETPGASTFYFDATSKKLAEIRALPAHVLSDTEKEARQEASRMISEYPLKTVHKCSGSSAG